MPNEIAASPDLPDRTMRLGAGALAVLSAVLLVAVAFLVWSSMTTASARFAASTTNESSLFEAASVDVVVGGPGGDSSVLRIDGDGLYPGLVVERCLPVAYRGTLTGASVRLIGRQDGGTGLGRYITTEIDRGSGSLSNCEDFTADRAIYRGTLEHLWQDHGRFATGLELLSSAEDGDSVVMRVRLEVVSDNDAQGLTTAFSLVIEGRP